MQPLYGVIMPIGPGEREIERAADVIASLFACENRPTHLVLIDDVAVARNLERLLPEAQREHSRITVFVNPRQGKGIGWSGGMCCGVAVAVRYLAQKNDVDFVLRLDTDSLVIGPFADKIRAFFAADPQIGVAGTFHRYPSGDPRKIEWMKPIMQRWIRPISFRWQSRSPQTKRGLKIGLNFAGRNKKRSQIMRRALSNNYSLGDHPQGGGYAISRVLLDRLEVSETFADPFIFRNEIITEDVMMGTWCYACGLKGVDFNRPGEPFGVQNSSIPGTPSEVLEKGYSVLYSIKSDEGNIRAFFQEKQGRAFKKI